MGGGRCFSGAANTVQPTPLSVPEGEKDLLDLFLSIAVVCRHPGFKELYRSNLTGKIGIDRDIDTAPDGLNNDVAVPVHARVGGLTHVGDAFDFEVHRLC